MEVLVAHEAEERTILIGHAFIAARRQVVATADQSRRPAMLETTVTTAGCVQQKQVSVEVRGHTKQSHVLFADRLDVVAETRHVDPRIAANRNCVRNASHLELANRQFSDLDRVIDQFGIVSSRVIPETVFLPIDPPKRRSDAPALPHGLLRWANFEFARSVVLTFDEREHACAIKKRVCQVEMGAADALVMRIYLENQRQFTIDRCRAPAGLVQFAQRDIPSIGLRPGSHYVLRVVANHVTARNPGRQRKRLPLWVRRRHGQANFKQMCGGIFRPDRVTMRGSHSSSLSEPAR